MIMVKYSAFLTTASISTGPKKHDVVNDPYNESIVNPSPKYQIHACDWFDPRGWATLLKTSVRSQLYLGQGYVITSK